MPKKSVRKPTPPERIPRVIEVPTIDDHLEVITRAIFQAGLSWALIDARWPAFRDAFEGFSVQLIAATYGEGEVERIMEADGVIHSRAKIAGTIANAKALAALGTTHDDVANYVRSFPTYAALYADARKRFAYLGDLSLYYWLFRTGLPVPPFERWLERQERDHPRMREMVEMGRSESRSSESIG